jgi:hypothetical protein
VVACCNTVTVGTPWTVVKEGVTNGTYTGDPFTVDPALFQPTLWQLQSSQLTLRGTPWGNPLRPGFDIHTATVADEQCTEYASGSLFYLDQERAYSWSNYSMSVAVSSSFGGSLVFRLKDPLNYYRFFSDRRVRLATIAGGDMYRSGTDLLWLWFVDGGLGVYGFFVALRAEPVLHPHSPQGQHVPDACLRHLQQRPPWAVQGRGPGWWGG